MVTFIPCLPLAPLSTLSDVGRIERRWSRLEENSSKHYRARRRVGCSRYRSAFFYETPTTTTTTTTKITTLTQLLRVNAVTGRMRNPGGFSDPPRQPEPGAETQRAIELLGNFTQRRMRSVAKLDELKALVGAVPKGRLEAQQWKVKLQRLGRVPRPAPKLLDLPLPRERNDRARLFILLEVVRKKHSIGLPISKTLGHKISKRIAGVRPPATTKEANEYIRTLAYYQRLLKRAEKRPPIIPVHDIDRLRQADQLLGSLVGNGRIGKDIHRLIDLIGSYPDKKNLARSWQKIIQGQIRRKLRKDRVYAKRLIDDQKRLQRRLKRMQRQEHGQRLLEAAQQYAMDQNDGGSEGKVFDLHQDVHDGNESDVTESVRVLTSHHDQVVTLRKQERETRGGFICRISSLIGSIFRPR